jgi:hypothetical protein
MYKQSKSISFENVVSLTHCPTKSESLIVCSRIANSCTEEVPFFTTTQTVRGAMTNTIKKQKER